jgi:hypothetical protein
VFVEPQHHRLDRRNVDDAGSKTDQQTVTQINERYGFDGNAESGNHESGNEKSRSDHGRQTDVALDNLAEKRRPHAEKENAERKGELNLRQQRAHGFGVSAGKILGYRVGKIGKSVNLPH